MISMHLKPLPPADQLVRNNRATTEAWEYSSTVTTLSESPDSQQQVSAPDSNHPCVDSESVFNFKDKRRKCDYMEDHPGICTRKIRIQKLCPLTCDVCEEYACVDAGKKFYVKGRLRSCSWVSEDGDDKKDKRCEKRVVKTTCRATCGFCDHGDVDG